MAHSAVARNIPTGEVLAVAKAIFANHFTNWLVREWSPYWEIIADTEPEWQCIRIAETATAAHTKFLTETIGEDVRAIVSEYRMAVEERMTGDQWPDHDEDATETALLVRLAVKAA